MATQTRVISTFGDSGESTFEVDYDDVSLLFLTIRCRNNEDYSFFASATQISTGKNYSQVFPPRQVTETPIPPGQANQLQIGGITPTGKWTDIRFVFRYPYTG